MWCSIMIFEIKIWVVVAKIVVVVDDWDFGDDFKIFYYLVYRLIYESWCIDWLANCVFEKHIYYFSFYYLPHNIDIAVFSHFTESRTNVLILKTGIYEQSYNRTLVW